MTPTSTWIQPSNSLANGSGLQIFNTLTKSKVPFIPSLPSGRVTWYSCGPTVYDAAHIGHARNYVTFDIIRRIFQNYFGYEVFYVMNITDVDDKIILRARQAHLVKYFFLDNPQINPSLKTKLEGFW
jgi:cysteinyl-tRNA synthetase